MKISKKTQALTIREEAQILRKEFYSQIRRVIHKARDQAYRSVNFIMVEAYWNVGRLIVEEEQQGEQRAQYGTHLVRLQ